MRLVASITVEAAKELGIAEGREVTAIVKASDVMLGVADEAVIAVAAAR
jgi:molybdopterin-binding protein